MMNILEKILEEMENESRLAHEEMRRCARGNPLQFDEVKGYARAMEYVVGTIRSHVDEVNNNGWIPVSERLPEDGTYLCTLSGELLGIDEPFTGMCGIENGKWDEEGCVIAWRPLPEPYRPEE